MKKLFAVLTLILTLFLGGQTARAYTLETYDMEGTIGTYKVKIYLKLNISTGKATGWYYYKSKGAKNKIQLSGTVKNFTDCGNVKLTEKVNGKVTGTFSGEFCESARGNMSYYGTWTSPSGKKLSFELDDMWND